MLPLTQGEGWGEGDQIREIVSNPLILSFSLWEKRPNNKYFKEENVGFLF